MNEWHRLTGRIHVAPLVEATNRKKAKCSGRKSESLAAKSCTRLGMQI